MKKSPADVPNRKIIRYSAADKLKVVKLYLEDGHQAKQIAEQFHIGRSSIAKWAADYRERGVAAFTTPPCSATEPLSPDLVQTFVAARIIEHKEAHPDHGIKRLIQIFRRFLGLPVTTHQVRQVLKKQQKLLPAPVRKARTEPAPIRFFERQSPNELWHTDVMYFIMPNREKVFVIGYLDDYSRYVVGMDIFHRQTVTNTLDLLKKSCGDYTFPKEILTDGGRQFVSWTGNNQFGTYLRNHNIKHTVCRAHHPQTNGKMERFWRTLRLEFFDKAKIMTFDDLCEQLQLYVKHYNFQRPHQGIGGMTPSDRFFEIETEVKKEMARKIAENALEIALKGTVKKPFFMVGRVGDSSVAIREDQGRLSMQIDGVDHPAGNLLNIDLIEKKNTQSLDKHNHLEDINHGKCDTNEFVAVVDRIQSRADGTGEMQSDPVDLDGKSEHERGVSATFGATTAGGALGSVGIGGDAAGAGSASAGMPGSDNGAGELIEPFGEVVGPEAESVAAEGINAGNEIGKQAGSDEKINLQGASANGRNHWRVNSNFDDFSITI